ncbi:APC family permease [Vibrio sp. SCSIO 43136]|uniref:APC family permease n=1 Tax=Vibrio sp. SCSIO 43136 TaxID=2819101 RepID=UPI0020764FE2|nr:APC family permease [Vibrio sp. SCSIO 43136]USD67886.1 APC family permease [Vibrio sp. SCSIO 43136]
MSDKNKFGLPSIVLLGFNAIIGSGIFLLPNALYAKADVMSIALILFTMLIVSTIAVCFAEAAGHFNKNGAAYVYVKEAYGPFAGFQVGFLKWVMACVAWAAMSAAFSTLLVNFAPEVFDGYQTYIIAGMVILLTIVNMTGVDASKYVNNVATIGKLLPLIVFVVVGVFYINWDNVPLNPMTQFAEYSAKGFEFDMDVMALAVVLCFYAFTGFEGLATAAEDMKDPAKNLPRAIMLVMAIVSAFYLLIMMVCMGVLGDDLANTKVPVADAAGVFLGEWGYMFVMIGSIVSIAGINVAASFMTPRTLTALAEDKLLPETFGKKNEKGVPTIAILLTGAAALPIALSGSFTMLAALSVVTRFAQYIPTCLAVLKLRKMYPERELSFKIPFGPVVPYLAAAICVWLLTFSDAYKIAIGLGAMVAITPFYFMARKKYAAQEAEAATAEAK